MFELQLLCPEEQIETISEALDALDALSVSIEDNDANTQSEQALFGEPGMPLSKEGWQHSRVIALFETQNLADEAARLLVLQDFFESCSVLGVKIVPDQDWVRLTQSQFEPVEITPTFWIVPTWHEPPKQAKTMIRLDPGLAFGTGTHPTTRLCLRWIAHQAENGLALGSVLDYGCGSGILAIAAAKHGANCVDAVDIDLAAVQSTLLNAKANQVQLRAALPEQLDDDLNSFSNHYSKDLNHLNDDLISEKQKTRVYQIVLANILATPLKVLAPLLCAHVDLGGYLVLSGILERQADELIQTYSPWVTLEVAGREEGWILMTARK